MQDSSVSKTLKTLCSWPAGTEHIACGLKPSAIDRDTPDSDSSDFSLVSGVAEAILDMWPSTCGPALGC